MGVAACIVCVAAALAVEVEQGPLASAIGVQRTEPVVIRSAEAGHIARWMVTAGASVASGEPLAQLDTRSIDAIIDALKKQIRAIRTRVEAIQEEIQAYSNGDMQSSARARLAVLDAQKADLDREDVGLTVQLAMHEKTRTRAMLTSPVGGRLAEIAVADGGAFKAQAVLATIVPEAGRVRLDVTWPKRGSLPLQGQSVRAWAEGSLWPLEVYAGVIESVEEADNARVRTRIALDVRGSALDGARPREHQLRFTVQRAEQRVTLLAHLFAPLTRPPAHGVIAALHP
jgi:multidrug efflux pump subunit AcrA (membrane-fusion protein)